MSRNKWIALAAGAVAFCALAGFLATNLRCPCTRIRRFQSDEIHLKSIAFSALDYQSEHQKLPLADEILTPAAARVGLHYAILAPNSFAVWASHSATELPFGLNTLGNSISQTTASLHYPGATPKVIDPRLHPDQQILVCNDSQLTRIEPPAPDNVMN